MTTRRKTVSLEDLRRITNATIANAQSVEARNVAADLFAAVTLKHENAYRGFMYVDRAGDAVSHTVIGSGAGYDPSRRFYF